MTKRGSTLQRLAHDLCAAAAVGAADRLGVFDALGEAPADADAVATRCRLSRRGATALLEALDAVGVAERVDGRFRVVPGAVRMAHMAREVVLDDVIRTGRPHWAGDSPDGASKLYPDIVEMLGAKQESSATRLANLLPPYGQVLDIGAGAAYWSIAYARRHPECRVTTVDLPAVTPVTTQAVDAAGLSDRFTVRSADMFTVELPSTFDVVLLGNICHLFDTATNVRLLGRLREVLRPRGSLVIVDVLPCTDAQACRAVSLYALGLLIRTATGGVHSEADYRNWATSTGFGPLTVTPIGGDVPLSVLSASI